MPPKQQLSKGTLGLKFMNRVVPSSPASAPPPPPPPLAAAQQPPAATAQRTKPAPTAATSTSSAPTKLATSRTKVAPDSAPAPPARPQAGDDDDWSRRTVGGTRTVIHESSLLSFPLLATLSSRASTSTSTSTSTFTSTNVTYSSMPLTAGAIPGRRSYGGANVEIEKLNDPSSHQAPPATAESKSALKKRQKAERDAETVPVRRSATGGGSTLSSAKTGKRTAALEAERRGIVAGEGEGGEGTKRRRTGDLEVPTWDGGEDEVALGGGGGTGAGAGGFARPAGFEGARATGKGKGKGRAGAGAGAGDALLRDDGEEHRWGARGETRAWDEDKAGDDSGSDVDVEGMSDLGGMSGEEDDDESDDSVEVAQPVKVKQDKAQKKQEVERAFERSEEGRKAVRSKRRR
ncbi:hypothetical protein JCM9279_002542 [Rhodotorula babjevae]